jgi:hypothetical protein
MDYRVDRHGQRTPWSYQRKLAHVLSLQICMTNRQIRLAHLLRSMQ